MPTRPNTAPPHVQISGQYPRELLDLHQWCVFMVENSHPSRPALVVQHPSGIYAEVTDRYTWSTFECAAEALERRPILHGIGFVLTTRDPYTAVCLADCVSPETGDIAPWAWDIAACFDSYTAVSEDGSGLTILIRGKTPGSRHRLGVDASGHHIAMYTRARFVPLTGRCLDTLPSAIQDGQEVIDLLEDEFSWFTSKGDEVR